MFLVQVLYNGSAITPKHLSQLGHEHMAYSKVPPAGFWPVRKAILGAKNSFSHSGQIVMVSIKISRLKYVILLL
ncbi:MAG: hypothetical protein WCE91_10850, partial [Nitrososphaeraceae archaeon]